MLHRNRCLMQGQPLVQQCWGNQQDAQSCSPAAEAQSLFCWTTHIWTLYHKVIQPLCVLYDRTCAFSVWFLAANKLFVNSSIYKLSSASLLITVCLSFLLSLFSQGHLLSVCACRPSPTSSYFTWCDSEVWVVVTTEDTGPSLFYLRSFCCCKHIAHLLLR